MINQIRVSLFILISLLLLSLGHFGDLSHQVFHKLHGDHSAIHNAKHIACNRVGINSEDTCIFKELLEFCLGIASALFSLFYFHSLLKASVSLIFRALEKFRFNIFAYLSNPRAPPTIS